MRFSNLCGCHSYREFMQRCFLFMSLFTQKTTDSVFLSFNELPRFWPVNMHYMSCWRNALTAKTNDIHLTEIIVWYRVETKSVWQKCKIFNAFKDGRKWRTFKVIIIPNYLAICVFVKNKKLIGNTILWIINILLLLSCSNILYPFSWALTVCVAGILCVLKFFKCFSTTTQHTQKKFYTFLTIYQINSENVTFPQLGFIFGHYCI